MIGVLCTSVQAFETAAVSTQEPRAFGYAVGDVMTRVVTIDVPARLALDKESLPRHGSRGKAIELRDVEWRDETVSGGTRHVLRLDYQVFVAPREVRTFELPALTLRLAGKPRDEDVRIDSWPVTVAALAPVEPSPRHGLGELRPDRTAPAIDTFASRARLVLYAATASVLLGYLAFVYLGVPWWNRRHRPFSMLWRDLRGLGAVGSDAQWRAACARVHQALNRAAGHVLFEAGIERFIAKDPRYKALRDDLVAFFRRSNEAFFSGHPTESDHRWLIDLCRRLRDAERGAA